MPRIRLTADQQAQILGEEERRRQNGEDASQAILCQWAALTFGLKRTLPQSTMSKLLAKKGNKLRRPRASTSKKTGTLTCNELEDALVLWIHQCAANQSPVSDIVIKDKGAHLLALYNERRNPATPLKLAFSNGWLHSFKTRHGLKRISLHAERASVCQTDTATALEKLRCILAPFAKEDIFNAAQCTLQYRLAPEATIQPLQMQGKPTAMKDDARITALMCANADGSLKYPLRIIGNTRVPSMELDKRAMGDNVALDYVCNGKAWMTYMLFVDWLQSFDRCMHRRGRKVVLLLDNCATYDTGRYLPTFQNVTLHFLPPSTPSALLHPMGAGVIGTLKCRYRHRQIAHALDLQGAGVTQFYNVRLLQAMEWLRSAWESISPAFIESCFTHARLIGSTADSSAATVVISCQREKEANELAVVVASIVPSTRARMTVSTLLNHPTEMEHEDDLSDDALLDLMQLPADGGSDPGVAMDMPDSEEQLRLVSMTKLILEHMHFSDDDIRKGLTKAQAQLRLAVQDGATARGEG